jgi:hypothetical protein
VGKGPLARRPISVFRIRIVVRILCQSLNAVLVVSGWWISRIEQIPLDSTEIRLVRYLGDIDSEYVKMLIELTLGRMSSTGE